MKKLLTIVLICFSINAFAQSVGIGTTTPNASAMLDVSSTSKGILIPRMTKAERQAIGSPADGLIVYQTSPDSIGFHYYAAFIGWTFLVNGSKGWGLNGNTGITNSDFLGTTDNSPLIIKANNVFSGGVNPLNNNTYLGYNIANALFQGNGNTALGAFASRINQGSGSVAIGYQALYSETNADGIVAIGRAALFNNNNRINNLAMGDSALFSNGIGSVDGQSSYNIAIGSKALKNNTTGNVNTAIGFQSLVDNTTGFSNIALGHSTLNANISGYRNIAIGHEALAYNKSNSGNIAIGQGALVYFNELNTETKNITIGHNSMRGSFSGANHFGKSNTVIGDQALLEITTGSNNSAVGVSVLKNISTGSFNAAIGDSALFNNTSGYSNVAIGSKALFKNNISSNLVAIGDSALFNNTGNFNVAIGSKTLYSNTFGYFNIAIGLESLRDNTIGNFNTAVGAQALSYLNSGDHNTVLGHLGFAMPKGSKNTLIGSAPNYGYNIGDSVVDNIIIGARYRLYLRKNKNVIIGNEAGGTIEGGSNTSIGDSSLFRNSAGEQNVALGAKAGGSSNKNNNVYIGYQAGYNANSANKLYIESDPVIRDSTTSLIYGDFAADSLNLNGKVNIKGYTRLGTVAEAAPAIKMKEFVVTSGSTSTSSSGSSSQGFVNHGLNSSKIISATALLEWTTGFLVPPEYTADPLLRYNYFITPTQIIIQNNAATCAYICGKQVRIVVTYKE